MLVVLEIAAGILGFVFRNELVRDRERYLFIVHCDVICTDWSLPPSLDHSLPVSQQTSELENRMNDTFIDYRAVGDDDYSEEVNDVVTYIQKTVWLQYTDIL